MSKDSELFELLLNKNACFLERFNKSLLMQLIKSNKMAQKQVREKLLDCIQVFSDSFQNVVMLRGVFNDSNKHKKVVQEHLNEEFGHNLSLSAYRKGKEPIWDPVLDSASCWFVWRMFTLDNNQKTVLVHLVLESSANIFFKEAHRVMRSYGETDYFRIHAEADEHHEKMGLDLLSHTNSNDYENLYSIQKQGWDVLQITCDRIAVLAMSNCNTELNYHLDGSLEKAVF